MAANNCGILSLPGSLPSPSTHANFIQMTPRQQDAKLTQGKYWDGSNSTNQISSLMPWSFQQLGWQLYCWWNRGQPWSRTNLPEYTVPERSHGKHSLPTLDHGTEAEGTEVRVMGYCKYASHWTTRPALPWETSIKIHIGVVGRMLLVWLREVTDTSEGSTWSRQGLSVCVCVRVSELGVCLGREFLGFYLLFKY